MGRKTVLLVVTLLLGGGFLLLSEERIRVGVFDGYGGAQTCVWEAVEAVKVDPAMEVETVTPSQIASRALDRLDVLIIPGGGGSRQFLTLGAENHERIRRWRLQQALERTLARRPDLLEGLELDDEKQAVLSAKLRP